MDQYTRRIIGFGIRAGVVDSVALCRMFQQAIRDAGVPKYLSSDHDPLYRFHQWQANLRILDVTEIKTVPYVPLSHPFIERLIGTIRRECLDRLLFWTGADLEGKLTAFKGYYNEYCTHSGLNGKTPVEDASRKKHRFQLLWMETALSRSISDANGRVNTNSLGTRFRRFRRPRPGWLDWPRVKNSEPR
jgi:transposase InsO family protein